MAIGGPGPLCWRCASNKGLTREFDPSTLMQTEYQLKKFIKHTVPNPVFRLASVFKDPTIKTYQNWVVNSVASGCVTFDSAGRHAYVFVAGREVGVTYKHGSFHTVGDAVKVVLPTDPLKVHAYPMSSHVIVATVCSGCGAPLPT